MVNMTFKFTLFKSVYDNKTDKSQAFDEWQQFEDLLYALAKKPGVKKGPDAVPLISPATYQVGETRRNANVIEWSSWCALDVDDYEGSPESFLESIPYYYVCYSTASSTKEKPKFRLVFPLSHAVTSEDIKHFWHAVNKTCLDIGDAQTKDLSRMYFIPAQYPDAFNFIYTHKGPFMNPIELMDKYPRVSREGSWLPPELQEQVDSYNMKQKRSELTNTMITWNGYYDCPFFPKELAAEYMSIRDTGWYSKMYSIMISIAGNAIFRKYPITANQIAELCKEFDRATGNWYENRPLDVEAERALTYVLANG